MNLFAGLFIKFRLSKGDLIRGSSFPNFRITLVYILHGASSAIPCFKDWSFLFLVALSADTHLQAFGCRVRW
jgi:hypothetical protein